MAAIAADRNLLFGLIALQNGLIVQDQLLGAFRAWTLDKARALADLLVDRGDLSRPRRELLEALVEEHLKEHGGDAERSLAAITAGRSTRESLAQVADPDLGGSLAQVSSVSTSSTPSRLLTTVTMSCWIIGPAGQPIEVSEWITVTLGPSISTS